MKRLVVVALLAGLCGGCSSTNIAELMKAMGENTATVCIQAQWGGGMVIASRTNITNGDVQCQPNGLTVKSSSQTVPVGVTIQPTGAKP